MKKLIYIIAVAVIMVLAAPVASFAHGHGHHGCGSSFSVGVSFGMSPYSSYSYSCFSVGAPVVYQSVVYQPAPVVVYTPPVVYRTAVVEPVVMPTGHWETRIVRYETVTVPITHPAVYDWYWDGSQWVSYMKIAPWTEMVQQQRPVYGQVWVSP